jgi:hypothetical protein
MRSFCFIELQCFGYGIQDGGRGSGYGSAFEFGVVLNTYAGEHGDL